MKQIIQAETHVIDRLLYTLSEGSVSQLVKEDSDFARFIEQLHDTLQVKSQALQRQRLLL